MFKSYFCDFRVYRLSNTGDKRLLLDKGTLEIDCTREKDIHCIFKEYFQFCTIVSCAKHLMNWPDSLHLPMPCTQEAAILYSLDRCRQNKLFLFF